MLGMLDPALLQRLQQIQGISGPVAIPETAQGAAPGGLLGRLKGGLGRFNQGLGNRLFPMLGASGLTPEQIQQTQTAGRTQLGLGLLSNIGSGKGFGAGLGNALQFAQGNVQQAQQQASQAALLKQQQERQTAHDAREIAQQDWQRGQAEAAVKRQGERDTVSDQRFEVTLAASAAEREAQRGLTREQLRQQRDLAEQARKTQFEIASLKGTGQKPTEYDKKATLLHGEMRDSATQLDRLDQSGATNTSSIANRALGASPITRIFTSNDYRKYEAAGERWAQNFLYLKSGAQAPEQEVQRTMKQYLPQPGDGPEVIAQKTRARQEAMRNVEGILNPAVGGGQSSRKVVDFNSLPP